MSNLNMRKTRTFQRTHPWLTFSAKELMRPNQELWMMLGECQSKCEHIAGAALDPEVAQELRQIYLEKGVRGTAAIEGNTLSDAEIDRQIHRNLVLPLPRAY